MHYESFTLENYKGISQAVTVSIEDTSKTPTCLVGNNESGKTTILKGIELIGKLSHGHRLRDGELAACRPKKAIHYTGTIRLSTRVVFDQADVKGNEEDPSELSELKASLRSNNKRASLEFCFHYKNSELISSNAMLRVGTSDSSFEDFMDFLSELPDIIYLDDFSFDIPDQIRISGDGNTNSPIEGVSRPHNDFWASVLEDIFKGATLNDAPDTASRNALMQEWRQTPSLEYFNKYLTSWTSENEGDEDAIEQRMAKMNSFLNSVVTRDWEDISGLKSSFERFEITRSTNSSNGYLYFDYQIKAFENGNAFRLSERSKGCRWFFCFKLLTQIRSYRDHSQTVFLLDEPASNLHIHPQDRILSNIIKLAKSKKKVVYSTHAPHLIDTQNLDHCLLVENRKTRETANADICVKSYPEFEDESSAVEPIHERITLMLLNAKQIPWKIWWSRLKEANELSEILEKAQELIP